MNTRSYSQPAHAITARQFTADTVEIFDAQGTVLLRITRDKTLRLSFTFLSYADLKSRVAIEPEAANAFNVRMT